MHLSYIPALYSSICSACLPDSVCLFSFSCSVDMSAQPSPPSVFKKTAPNREERLKCWASRDDFWNCIKLVYNKNEVPTDLTETVKIVQCKEKRSVYEASCPESWVSLIDHGSPFDDRKTHNSGLNSSSLINLSCRSKSEKSQGFSAL